MRGDNIAYKAILVHVPLANSKVQVELAARLAKAFGAHLTGICSLTETAMLRSAVQNPFIRLEADKVEDLIKQETAEATTAEKTFDGIATDVGVPHSWLTGEGDAADLIILASRLQDLTVVEQCQDPSDLLWARPFRSRCPAIPRSSCRAHGPRRSLAAGRSLPGTAVPSPPQQSAKPCHSCSEPNMFPC